MSSHHQFDYPEEILKARAERQTEQNAPAAAPAQKKPQISPTLQKAIEQRLKAAELPPVSNEFVRPEGATIEVKRPKYTPRADSNTVSAELPSQFVFYDFKDLFLGKFKTRHYAKLHEAHITRSMAYLVECLSDVMSTSHPEYQDKPLAFHLTIPDFYWVLYYMRLDQIKVSLTHTTMCQNPEHVQMVKSGSKTPESLKITTTVDRSQIHTKILAAAPDAEEFTFEDFELRPARMLDVIESLDHPDYLTDPDIRYLCRVASLIRIKDSPDATIEERIAIIDELDYEELAKIGRYEQIVTSYGPDEFINVLCRSVGISAEQKFSLMPVRFFPFSSYTSFLERQTLYMLEFKSPVPPDMPLVDFFWLSERAEALRNSRKEAIEEGRVPL